MQGRTNWNVEESEAVEAIAILQEIANEDDIEFKVLDVGAHSRPFVFATHVMDLRPHATRGQLNYIPIEAMKGSERFTEHTWNVQDICDTPWPYEDNEFDVVWCSHTLEDVRDPIAAIKEISRVGKCGYISTINRNYESLFDINSPHYAGYTHHRWFVEIDDADLLFTFKYPLIHMPSKEYTPFGTGDWELTLWWTGEINGKENILQSLAEIENYMAAEVERARQVTGRIHD